MLAQGCGGGSNTPRPAGGGATAPPPSSVAPSFDPSSYTPPKIAFSSLKKLYAYDSKSFLDAVLVNSPDGDGVTIEDITFSDTKGGTIPAYVVTPATVSGRMPGVVFAHAAGGNRDAWLPELTALAKQGITAMATDVPLKVTGDASADSATVLAAVLAHRRALDLLGRRDDTDPSRLAFVGHGWGGALGQILAALENRLSGVVFAGAGSRLSQTMVVQTKVANRAPYLDALTRFDGARYVSVTGTKRSVLFQFGKQDATVPAGQVAELVATTVGAKQRKDYDTGADLVTFATAAADRQAFLRKVLRVK